MVKVIINTSNLKRTMADMEKQVRMATATAMTRTALKVRDDLKNEMSRVFDRPTPFTMNSVKITPATKKTLEAKVWFKDPPRLSDRIHYLEPQVYGGGRPIKRFERWLQQAGLMPQGWFAVPGPAARRDLYGNMSRRQIVQILSGLRAMPNPDANRPYRYGLTRGSRARKKLPDFMLVAPGGKAKPGVWQRSAKGTFQQVLVFVPNVTYRRLFRFFEVSKSTINREMQRQFDKALPETLATAWR